MSYENQQSEQATPQAHRPDSNQRLRERCQRKHFVIESSQPCGKEGDEVRIPTLRPQVEIRWGDGPNDQIETDDLEVICIVASNPYPNVTLKNFTVVFAAVHPGDGSSIPCLPDGTPSVSITPSEMISFGDLPPHNPNQPDANRRGEAREVVLLSRGARPGDYLLKLHYSYSVEVMGRSDEQFKLELHKS